MRIVLDSNEYILTFGEIEALDSADVVRWIALTGTKARLFVPRMVSVEVRRNLRRSQFKDCLSFWMEKKCKIDDDRRVPKALLRSYQDRNLKPADALIAAYSEWVRTDFLVSENRDFLALTSPLPFRVLKAAEFLKRQRMI